MLNLASLRNEPNIMSSSIAMFSRADMGNRTAVYKDEIPPEPSTERFVKSVSSYT